ncbi:MAG: hypothetical protein WA317_00835 [Mycobacterium sp.]|uniref:hypothetical protein n=1 Tax=Mycobacterium sp. TaxID=1785 RepID=UPI003CC5DA90
MLIIFAGAATIATLALFSAARPGDANPVVASGSVHLVAEAIDLPAPATASFGPQFLQAAPKVVGVDDNGNSVNDNGQTSGDVFTQNAQDQSTA